MNHTKKTAFLYTVSHFMVDFTTIYLITKVLTGPPAGIANQAFVLIAYNLLAFAGQLPIGILSDMLQKNRLVAACGCALAGIAYPIALFSPWSACVLGSLGNGAFHIGAGADILKMSMPKAGLSGIFVSSGALGVWLAYKANGTIISWLCPLLMVAIVLVLLKVPGTSKKNPEKIHFSTPGMTAVLAVSCFSLTIVIRSLLGMVMDFHWKSVPLFSFLFVLAVAGGKALGGLLGDRFGYAKTAVVSLLLALIAFFFAFEYPFWGIIAVLSFNMTMPLTLTAIASLSGQKYGFAFGITTFALAIGFIPVVFNADRWFGTIMLASSVSASLILMVLGYVFIKLRTRKGGI